MMHSCCLRRTVIVAVCVASLAFLFGCSVPRRLHSPQRKELGLVLVLPGIEGQSKWNRDIALGLDEGGVTSAIEVYDWTSLGAGSWVTNLTNLKRNRREAAKIAKAVHAYRLVYPRRPIHLVGHSGGGGIAVLTLEALPKNQPVTAALLLAPALSPSYDLTDALQRTSQGIYNFYSEKDVTLLKLGTTLFGSIDRKHEAAAGAVGFQTPNRWTADARALYEARLRQVAWSPRLEVAYGVDGSHLGWADRDFAREYLAPIIKENEAAYAARRDESP